MNTHMSDVRANLLHLVTVSYCVGNYIKIGWLPISVLIMIRRIGIQKSSSPCESQFWFMFRRNTQAKEKSRYKQLGGRLVSNIIIIMSCNYMRSAHQSNSSEQNKKIDSNDNPSHDHEIHQIP